MSPLTLKKSRASKRSVPKVSLDRRRQERMCSGDALATPHFAQTGKTLLPLMESIASLNKGGINSLPNSQQITNNDNSAQLTSFLARTADEILESFPLDQRYYRSASNSLQARTADKTSKTFALQGDPSRSTHTPSSKRSPYIVSRGRPCRHMESSSTFKRISSPNGDIEKIIEPLRSHISSPSCQDGRQGQRSRRGCCRHPILTPVKLSSQP
ncbi:hypothetical protein AVEN_236867-1 [Araneus ventricosus]|uniref:Uncharacterized protein n=1 Tax=Araneus ventricosus TaxID=182803 RepID=A0A4Y2WP90_ARAVE|nr:hypothetical protein AVEN_236867-1 [Araneus ventricosus]